MKIGSDSLAAQHPMLLARQKDDRVQSQTPGFVELLAQGVAGVNEMQTQSSDQISDLLAGKEINSAEVFTGIQKADMSFRLMVQIRNKLMRAYEEINNIRI